MAKTQIKRLLQTNAKAVVRGLFCLEDANLFKPEHRFLLTDLCDWWRQFGHFTAAQYENVRLHLIKSYLPELWVLAVDKSMKGKEKKMGRVAKSVKEREAEYSAKWEKEIQSKIDAARKELQAANERLIDAWVKKNGLPPKDGKLLENLVLTYGWDGIYDELDRIAAKYGYDKKTGKQKDADEDDEPISLDDDLDLDDDLGEDDEPEEEEVKPPKRGRGRPPKSDKKKPRR